MSPLGHLLKLVLYYAPYFSSMEICTMPVYVSWLLYTNVNTQISII